MSDKIYLVELDATNGTTITTYRYCTGKGYTSLPTDTPANAYYEPRVIQPGLFRQSMFAQGTTSGASSGSNGETVLVNPDGGLDALVDLGFDGQAYVLKEGYEGAALSTFKTVLTGIIEQAEFSWDRLTLRLKDRNLELNMPVQKQMYAGTNTLPNGLDGTSEIKGKIKPMLFGQCFNITPICVNTAKLVYQINTGAVNSITNVRDMGVELTLGVDYATSALLLGDAYYTDYTAITFSLGVGSGFSGLTPGSKIGSYVWAGGVNVGMITANTETTVTITNLLYGRSSGTVTLQATGPTTATFDTCLAEGLFRLGSMPAGQITCDAIQGANTSDRTTGQIMKTIARKKLPILATTDLFVTPTAVAGTYSFTNGLYRVVGNNTGSTVSLSSNITFVVGKTYRVSCTVFADGIITPYITQNGVTLWTGVPAINTWAQVVEFDFVCTVTGPLILSFYYASNTVGRYMDWGAIKVNEITGNYVAEQPIKDLDIAAPYSVGLYISTNMTYVQAFDLLCLSVGAWWGFDNSGVFWCTQLQAPVASNSITTLTQAEIISLERVATADGGGKEVPVWKADKDYGTIDGGKGVPLWRVNAYFNKNWTPQTSGLAGSVTEDKVNQFALESTRISSEDSAVKSVHRLASEVMIPTLLNTEANAKTEATRVLALRKVRRDRLRVQVSNDAIFYPAGGYWDNEAISEPSSGYASVVQFGDALIYGSMIYMSQLSNSGSVKTLCLDLSNPTNAWVNNLVTDTPTNQGKSASVIYNNKLFRIGGNPFPGADQSFASVHRSIDLTNSLGAWDESPTDLPVSRESHKCVLYGSYVYVLGGITGSGFGPATNVVLRLNLAAPTGAWETCTPTPVTSYGWSAFVYGSNLYAYTTSSATIYKLDLTNPFGAWTTFTPSLPAIRSGTTVAIIGTYVYLIGGGSSGSVIRIDMANPVAWDDSGVTDLPTATSYDVTSVVYNGSIYVIRGYTLTAGTYKLRTNSNPDDVGQLTSLGRTFNIKYPRYGYTAGRPMKLIGIESDYSNSNITLDLWG